MNNTLWKPSLRWHARTLGVILLVCILFFVAIFWIAAKLPPPYQPRTPHPQATPWQTHSLEDL